MDLVSPTLIKIFALLLVPWLFSPAHAFTSKDDCLKRVEEFNTYSKSEAPQQVIAPHHANTIFELKKKCSLTTPGSFSFASGLAQYRN